MVVQDESDKVIVCERGDLVFVFNFNPSQSFSDYGVGCRDSGSYKVGSSHLPVISSMVLIGYSLCNSYLHFIVVSVTHHIYNNYTA